MYIGSEDAIARARQMAGTEPASAGAEYHLDGGGNWVVRLQPGGEEIWVSGRTGAARWVRMTAEEWDREGDPWLMLVAAWQRVDPRSFWRLVCALGRRLWDRLDHEQERIAVAATERWLEDREGEDELGLLWFHAIGTGASPEGGCGIASEWLNSHSPRLIAPESASDLIRCLFGNPFRPLAAHTPWLTSTVLALARGIYEDRAFDRLPVLADALQDGGCADPDILAHCRSDGPHVRRCWVVDLVLGKG